MVLCTRKIPRPPIGRSSPSSSRSGSSASNGLKGFPLSVKEMIMAGGSFSLLTQIVTGPASDIAIYFVNRKLYLGSGSIGTAKGIQLRIYEFHDG